MASTAQDRARRADRRALVPHAPRQRHRPLRYSGFRARGLEMPRLTVRSNSPHLMYALVHTGRFLSLAPVSTLRLSGKRLGLKALPVDLPIQPGPIGLVTLKNHTMSPVAKLFVDCARKLAKPFAK